MDEKVEKYLYDVLACVERVESFFGDTPKLFSDFNTNMLLRQAIERNIEIMGEAMNRILKIERFTIKFDTVTWENDADLAPEYLYDIIKAA